MGNDVIVCFWLEVLVGFKGIEVVYVVNDFFVGFVICLVVGVIEYFIFCVFFSVFILFLRIFIVELLVIELEFVEVGIFCLIKFLVSGYIIVICEGWFLVIDVIIFDVIFFVGLDIVIKVEFEELFWIVLFLLIVLVVLVVVVYCMFVVWLKEELIVDIFVWVLLFELMLDWL